MPIVALATAGRRPWAVSRAGSIHGKGFALFPNPVQYGIFHRFILDERAHSWTVLKQCRFW